VISESNGLLSAALSYAERGWHVLPLHSVNADGSCTCGKPECGSIGKHPRTRHGVKDATTEEAIIRGWWKKWPDANVGIATGPISGILVVDLDNKDGKRGSDMFDLFSVMNQYERATLAVNTGNGLHLYYHCPEEHIKNGVGKDGIDVRSGGGYVVAPPSTHANGKMYEWQDKEAYIEELPEWLLGRFADQSSPQAPDRLPEAPDRLPEASDRLPEGTAPIPEGTRNDTLFKIGSAMRGKGMDEDEIGAGLLEVNAKLCTPPLSEEEVTNIAASASAYPPNTSSTALGSGKSDENPLYWFPLNTNWWHKNRNVRYMTAQQVGWYVWLMIEAWQDGGTLPNDPDWLWKLARAESKDEFQAKSDRVLAEFQQAIHEGEPMLVHPKLADIYKARVASYRQKVEAGKASAQKKKAAKAAAAQQDDNYTDVDLPV
jgi:uncharacterized protein YdaU (DUF1376 family)